MDSILQECQAEKAYMKKSFLLIQEKYDEIKKIELLVHEKHLGLEETLETCLDFFNNKLPTSLSQIRIISEQITELIRLITSSNSFNANLSKNDSSILYNSSKMFNKLKTSYTQQQNLQMQSNDFKLNTLESFLSSDIGDSSQAKCFLFGKLFKNNIKFMKEYESINDKLAFDQEAQILVSEVKQLIDQCGLIDKQLFEKYNSTFSNKSAVCTETFKNINKVRFF